jgi:O-antigen ligase
LSDELLAQLGGPLGGAGLAVLVLAPNRFTRLGGLAAWSAGLALLVPVLAPAGEAELLAAAAVAGAALAGALGATFVRWPWAVAVLTLVVSPVRVPVTVGETSANLLVPLYAVVAGAALALGWALLRGDARRRELGALAWPVALVVAWFCLSLAWTRDVESGATDLFFFILPFAVLAVAIARLPWSQRALAVLFGLLLAMAVIFAAVGLWQWATRDVFWNPKVIVANAYAPFYRVNSVFWDPSIYGRFLVVAILAAFVVIVFRALRSPRWELALGAAIVAAWIGLFVSFSQSSFVALAVGVVVVSALAWRWRALAAVGLVAAVMIPVGVAAPQLDNVRESVFGDSSSGVNRVTSGRLKRVVNGLRIAQDHPVAGVGIGGFKRAYAERLDRPPNRAGSVSHNTVVTVAAETGAVGVGLLAWLLVAAGVVAFRGGLGAGGLPAQTRLVAGICLGAIFVHSLFYGAFFEDPATWALLALAALAAAAAARRESA